MCRNGDVSVRLLNLLFAASLSVSTSKEISEKGAWGSRKAKCSTSISKSVGKGYCKLYPAILKNLIHSSARTASLKQNKVCLMHQSIIYLNAFSRRWISFSKRLLQDDLLLVVVKLSHLYKWLHFRFLICFYIQSSIREGSLGQSQC